MTAETAPSLPVILVVDDDEYVHGAVAAALRTIRVTALFALTAAEGLSAARMHRPNLAIIDLGLPDADGYELTRALRAEESLHDMRVLILTGHLPDQAAARAAGADAILGKPFRLHAFLDVVGRHLRREALAS